MDKILSYLDSNRETLESELTLCYLNNLSIETIKSTYYSNLITNENFTSDELYYLNMAFEEWFERSNLIIQNLHKKRDHLNQQMISLKQLKLPEQRSKEWYTIRENLLTASSLADALGKGHFQTRDDLLISKTSESNQEISKTSRDIMQWGVKYEPVATRYYEHLYNLKIIEFGLIPHPNLSVFGASPDGICDIGSPNGYEARMLEIKCPPKRKFTHDVPIHYWMQMQGQLEVCDLEECDFFQVKLEEYSNINEYEKDCLYKDKLIHGYTKSEFPKGLILSCKENDSYEYLYSPWLGSIDEILNWKQIILNNNPTKIYEEKWWRIERYECTLVRRDKSWWISKVPDIIKFWNDVVHYRNVGNEEVKQRIQSRKRGPRKKVFSIPEPLKGYLIDSDDEN